MLEIQAKGKYEQSNFPVSPIIEQSALKFINESPNDPNLFSIKWNEIAMLMVEASLFSFLMILPALLIYFSLPSTHPTYNILHAKGSLLVTNSDCTMEFLRYSLLVAVLYLSLIFGMVLIDILPVMIVKFVEWVYRQELPNARLNLFYVQQMKTTILTAIFTCSAVVALDILLFDTSFTINVVAGAAGKKGTTSEEAITKTAFWIERGLVVIFANICVYLGIMYAVQLLKQSFFKRAFAVRINAVNDTISILEKLYWQLCRGQPHLNPPVKHEGICESYSIALIHSTLSPLDCNDVSEQIFRQLCPVNRDYLIPADFLNTLGSHQVHKAFAIFDRQDTGKVTLDDMNISIDKTFKEHSFLSKSIENTSKLLQTIREAGRIFSMTIAFLLAVTIFDLGTSALMGAVGMIYVALSYEVQLILISLYKGFHFVFIRHAYDVGDTILVSGERLKVEKIDITSTFFRDTCGTLVYQPHSKLSSKAIYNLRRSGHYSQSLSFKLSSTKIENCWKFRDALTRSIAERTADFTGYLEIDSFRIADDESITMDIIYQQKGNSVEKSRELALKNFVEREGKILSSTSIVA